MKQKFYLFRQGQPVPKWLMNWESNDYTSEFLNSRKGKIVFGMSCIGIRTEGANTALIQVRPLKKVDHLILVNGLDNCKLGGVNGAAGCFIVSDEYLPEFDRIYKEHIDGRPYIFQYPSSRKNGSDRPENWSRKSVTEEGVSDFAYPVQTEGN